MSKKTFLILWLLLLSGACSNSTFNSYVSQPTLSNQLSSNPSSSPTPLSQKLPKLSEDEKQFIYKRILLSLIRNKDFTTGSYLHYEIKTIKPKYFEEIYNSENSNQLFPKNLINNFIDENKTTFHIAKNNSTLTNDLVGINGDQDMNKCVQRKNGKLPKIEFPFVLLSNLGIDDYHQQALVYMEFCGEHNNIIRKYFHLTLKDNATFDNDDYKTTSALVINQYPVGESK